MIKALELIPVLFMLIAVNILLSTYNSVARRHEVFSKRFLMDGIFKGILFTGGLLALAYVLEIVEISGFELTPAAILEAAMLFYAAKIAMALKDLIMSFDKFVIFEECPENEELKESEELEEQEELKESEELEEQEELKENEDLGENKNEIFYDSEESEKSEKHEELENNINRFNLQRSNGRLFIREIETED